MSTPASLCAHITASWLLTYLVHSTVLLSAALLLSRVLRGQSMRDALWKGALIGGVLTSTAQIAVGYTPFAGRYDLQQLVSPSASLSSQTRTSSDSAVAAIPAITAGRTNEALRDAEPADIAGSDVPGPDRQAAAVSTPMLDADSAATLLLAGWAVGSLLLLVQLIARHLRLHALLSDRRQVVEGGLPEMLASLRRNAGMWQPVWLSSSPHCPSPLALGTREICVPDRFLVDLTSEQQRVALAHELAHIARRDPVWHLIAGAVESIFFFQPLNRVARGRLREAAEYLCDDWAVRATGSSLALANCLAAVASWVAPGVEPIPRGVMAMAEGGSPLVTRVHRLLEGSAERVAGSRALRLMAVLFMLGLVAGAAPSIGTGTAAPSRERVTPSGTQRAESLTVVRLNGSGPLTALWSRAEQRAAENRDRDYWVAYAVPSTLHAKDVNVDDSDGWQPDELKLTSVARQLGVEGELASATNGGHVPAIMMFRMQNPRTGPVRLERVSVRSGITGMFLDEPVYWLGVIDQRQSFTWLCDLFDQLPGVELPKTVLEGIALHRDDRVAPWLQEIINDARNDEIRGQAVEGLAMHPSAATLAFLVRVARSDPTASIRAEAAETIGDLDMPEAEQALHDLAKHAEDSGVRKEAVETLGDGGRRRNVEFITELALSDRDRDMRLEATESLEEMPVDVAVPALRKLVWKSNDREVQRKAAESLGNVGSRAALEELFRVVDEHENQSVVQQAVEALGKFPSSQAQSRLERIARDHPMTVARKEAMEQLEQYSRARR